MVAISVWLADFDYEGDWERRRVGDRMGVDLVFDGSITATEDPDCVLRLEDGSIQLVSGTQEQAEGLGWIVDADSVRFWIGAENPPSRTLCAGRLWVRGYLPHAGTVEGTISSIRWHEANLKKVRGAHVKAGYKRSVEIDDTNEIDGLVPVWDPQPASLLDAGSEENSVQLPFYSPLPDDYEPSGYDIEFVLEVQGDRPRGAGQ